MTCRDQQNVRPEAQQPRQGYLSWSRAEASCDARDLGAGGALHHASGSPINSMRITRWPSSRHDATLTNANPATTPTDVPAQQRVRRHQPAPPHRPGEQPGQGGEHRPVGPIQLGLRVLPPQHRDLLAQNQQLGVPRRRRACQQRHPPGQADEHQVQHPYHHKPAILPVRPLSRLAYSQVSQVCLVSEPHRQQGQPAACRAPPQKTSATEPERPGSGLYGGSGSRLSPVWARNPSMRAGRYWMRLSRFLMMAASWSGVLHEPRLPRLLFMFAHAPSTGLRSGA